MEAINAEMQKHFKITAKKKLYFALGVMFTQSRQNVTECFAAMEAIEQMGKQDDAPEEIVDLIKGGIMKLCGAIRPVYCLTTAIEGYHQAMGEYPEFVKFMGLKQDADFPAAAKSISEMVDKMQKVFDGMADKKNPAPQLKNVAFGNDFIKVCESVKIKGEA